MQQSFNTPQEEQYGDASHEQSIIQHDPITHEQHNTITIQNLPDPSDVTTNNQPSLTNTTGSNFLDIHVRQITEHKHKNQNQDDTSTKLISNTNITQPLSIHHTSPRNYDPPPQYSTHTTSHYSPQQSSSNAPITNTIQNPPEVQFQTNTSTTQLTHQTLPYNLARTSHTQNTQPILTINTLHSNVLSEYTTSRNYLDLHYKQFLHIHFHIV